MIRRKLMLLLAATLVFSACKEQHKETNDQGNNSEEAVHDHSKLGEESVAEIKQRLTEEGYQLFDYVDPETGDTLIMQQYFMAFLKRGPERSQDSATTAALQKAHLDHLARMYREGFADISGPFGDDQEIRGVTIYNVPTLKMADSLANLDPMVKAGRLVIEIRPWWAAKGYPLR